MMESLRWLLLAVTCAQSHLLGIPTVPFTADPAGSYDLRHIHSIVVDVGHCTSRDHDGLTTIPPSLWEFAETFREDLADIGIPTLVLPGRAGRSHSIFLTVDGDKSQYLSAAGKETPEGYSLSIGHDGITISGASPLGTWWGSRTVLQQAILNDKRLTYGNGTDSPGWPERGMMLDVARHYYPADFLVEMCSYLSFFKQNVFHLHLSDHVWDPAKLSSHDLALELYAAFRPASEDPSIQGLARPKNETYSPSVLDSLQRKCARRGVTILPELESPGHSMATTDWKPEIALDDFSMLNLSHPETLPTVKAYWKALIGNFHSKTVHIGADEYDKNFINEYSSFVNAMHDYIKKISGKGIRIWGTFAPRKGSGAVNVDKDVTIQHWQIGQADGLHGFIDHGYALVNSDDFFYLDTKYSDGGVYPKELDIDRVFHGAPDGGPYAPNILDHKNTSNNPPRSSPAILGHLAVLWNDWGPNASTYHEAYHMVRDGLPALADKQWGGRLQQEEYASLFAALQPAVPGQNLDLRIPSKGPMIVSYDFDHKTPHLMRKKVPDLSGNGYDAHLRGDARVQDGALELSGHGFLETPLSSKGRNYTLSFSARPASHGGSLFSGPDSRLLNGNGTSPLLMFESGNIAYPVNLTLALDHWSDVVVEGVGARTFVSVTEGPASPTSSTKDDETRRTGREEVTVMMGIWGGYMQEAPMSIAAPIARIGEGFEGQIKDVKLSGQGLEAISDEQ